MLGMLAIGAVLVGLRNYIGSILSAAKKPVKAIAGAVADTGKKIAEAVSDNFLSITKVNFNLTWLRDDAKKKLNRPGITAVAVGDLRKMVELYPTVPEWKQLLEEEATHIIATIGNDQSITGAEFIKDISEFPDVALDEYINKTGEGMVIISGQ